MRLTAFSAGLVAISSLFAPAAAAQALLHNRAALDIDYKCAFRITYQLFGFVSTGVAINGQDSCNLYVGEGIVAGIGRFISRWGSLLAVVDNYKASGHYLGEFDDVYNATVTAAREQTGSTIGLEGFCPAWHSATKNGNYLYNSQVSVVRSQYEEPTKVYWKKYGIRLPLTRAAMTMVAITNGLGETGGTVGAAITLTNSKFTANVTGSSGSTLRIGQYMVDESEWLKKLLDSADELGGYGNALILDNFRELIKGGYYTLSSTFTYQAATGPVTLTCHKLNEPSSSATDSATASATTA
ncbi:hypothetical protein H4R19_005555 [Coemansia spiralis]|nr:hypothetical protein H4R19_005555 [Coemansia spiralis]